MEILKQLWVTLAIKQELEWCFSHSIVLRAVFLFSKSLSLLCPCSHWCSRRAAATQHPDQAEDSQLCSGLPSWGVQSPRSQPPAPGTAQPPSPSSPGERIPPRKTAPCLRGPRRGALLERAAPELQGAVNSQEPEPEPARLPPPPAVFTVAHMLCSGFVVPAACCTVVRLNARSWCQSLARFLASGHKFILKHKQRRR